MSKTHPLVTLKIVSDGRLCGTHIEVIDEAGEAIGDLAIVRNLTWIVDIDGPDHHFARAEMTVLGVETDIKQDVILTPVPVEDVLHDANQEAEK